MNATTLKFDEYKVLNDGNEASSSLLVAPVRQHLLSKTLQRDNCQKLARVGLKKASDCKPVGDIKNVDGVNYEVDQRRTYKPWMNNEFIKSNLNLDLIMSELITFDPKTEFLIKTNHKSYFKSNILMKTLQPLLAQLASSGCEQSLEEANRGQARTVFVQLAIGRCVRGL